MADCIRASNAGRAVITQLAAVHRIRPCYLVARFGSGIGKIDGSWEVVWKASLVATSQPHQLEVSE